jgi:ComEC/Rec2-related protein
MPIKKVVLLALGGLFIIIVLTLRFEATQARFADGQRVRVTGMVSQEPSVKYGNQRIKIGQFSFKQPQYPEYHYGDRLQVEGVVENSDFGLEITSLKVKNAPDMVLYTPLKPLLALRQQLTSSILRVLPERNGALLIGILLGTKNSLDPEFYDALGKTGTLHIAVASGTNVALFSGVLLTTLATYLGRRKALVITIFLIWFYVVLSGIQPPIVRAAFMASLAFSSQLFGREISMLRALFISALILLFINPQWITDVGFQLSFAATFGVVWVAPFLKRLLSKVSRLPEIVHNDFSTTIGAQIAVSPILLLNFPMSPWTFILSPIVNVLILWTIPIIMALGVLLSAAVTLWQPLGQLVAYFVWLPTEYVVRVVLMFAKLI